MDLLNTDIAASALVDDLNGRISELMEEAHVPGLSLTLIRGAEIFWSQAFGIQSRVSQEPVRQDTIFEAASLSKPAFAYACLKLCEEGVLDLDVPLSSYLPEPYVPDEARLELITMRHVLSHTSGFPNWRPKGQPLRIHHAPGERFSYSGEGYVYLQAVLERVTGQKAIDYIREKFLNPLGMKNSRFVWTGNEGLAAAAGHDEEGRPVDKALWPEMNGAASLHCTPTDFGRFVCAVIRPSSQSTARLSPNLTREMLKPYVQVNDSASWHADWPRTAIRSNDLVWWGLGWGIQRTATGDSFWHWGDNVNYRAFAVGVPERGDGIVIMTNGKKGHQVIGRIMREIVGGTYPGLDWLDSLSAG